MEAEGVAKETVDNIKSGEESDPVSWRYDCHPPPYLLL